MFKITLFLIAILSFSVSHSADLIDPTRPSNVDNDVVIDIEDSTREVVPKLQAIFISANRNSAVINGRRHYVGDEVAHYELVVVNKKSVVLRKDSQDVLLKISGHQVKKARLEK